jgi:hypothetical protein
MSFHSLWLSEKLGIYLILKVFLGFKLYLSVPSASTFRSKEGKIVAD